MTQALTQITLVVGNYDDAIAFYVGKLDFRLVEDTYLPDQDKRWVVVSPDGGSGASLLLAEAVGDEQATAVGNQAGGRVFLFLATDNVDRDYNHYVSQGIQFNRDPTQFEYGKVAVFEDLYGNQWDLIEYAPSHPMAASLKKIEP